MKARVFAILIALAVAGVYAPVASAWGRLDAKALVPAKRAYPNPRPSSTLKRGGHGLPSYGMLMVRFELEPRLPATTVH